MKKYDGRRGIALLLCLLLCLQMCLPPTAVLAEDSQQNIEYTASGYSGTYDGKPHSISVNVTTPEGATVSYAYPVNSEYSSTNPSFTDAGNYPVAYMIEKESYETKTGTTTVSIQKADISDKVEATLPGSFTYTGNPVQFALSYDCIDTWEIDYLNADGQSISAPSEAGSYTAKIIGSGTNHTATIFHSFTIVEPEKEIDYDVEGFDVEYDGKPHSISLNIHTEGVTATYATSEDGPYSEKNPEFIAIGTYVVFYKLEKSGYSTKEGSVTVAIKPINISDEIEATLPSSFTWTGKPVQFNPPTDKIKEWSIVYRLGDGYLDSAPSEVDDQYAVAISGESDTYRADISHKFSIVKAGAVIEYTARDYSGTYDGRQHSIALDVATPDVTVTYATSANGTYTETKPTFTSAGRYTVYYRLEGEGYETAEDSATVTISRANVSGLVTFNEQDEYPFTGSPVSFDPSCSGIFTWTFTYYDEGGKQLTQAPSDAGSYSVSIYGSGTNYYARVSHAYRITAQEIEYTVSDYTGAFDGGAHTIDLSVTTEGVTATFATSEGGAYTADKPSFTEPGEYTVWFRLEKAGYKTVTSSASVTITELQKIRHDANDYVGYYDGKAHSITLSVATEGVTVTYAESRDGTYSAENPTFTEPGSYTVWFRLEKAGYETDVNSASVTILELRQIEYSVEDNFVYYDGQPHSISLNVITEGVTVTYVDNHNHVTSKTPPVFTEPGIYIVAIKLEKEGYTTHTDDACVTIDNGKIEYNARGYSGYADGKPHSISLNVSTPDATVTYSTFADGEYIATKPSFTKAGTYNVYYWIKKEHYGPVFGSEVVRLRQPKEYNIVYSVEDYIGAYDGEAHTIAMDVTTSGVKATYATSKGGKYGETLPTFTEPGSYTVWYRLEKSGYETETGSATVTIEKAEQVLYFSETVLQIDIRVFKSRVTSYTLAALGLKHEKGDGVLSLSSSDPDRIITDDKDIASAALYFDVSNDEWSKGYSLTLTITAAETDHYKAATATCTLVGSGSVQGSYAQSGIGKVYIPYYLDTNLDPDIKFQGQDTLLKANVDLTIRPVTDQDSKLLSGVSNELRKKLMAAAGSDKIGAMAVDAVLTDKDTGEELHSTNGDLTISFSGELLESYQQNYQNMACYAVHIKQYSTDTGTSSSTAASQDTNDTNSTATATPDPYKPEMAKELLSEDEMLGYQGLNVAFDEYTKKYTNQAEEIRDIINGLSSADSSLLNMDYNGVTVKRDCYGWVFSDSTDSNGEQFLTSAVGDMTVVPVSSLSSKVELIRCELTENGVVIKDTSLSPFLLIYGPKEAFSDLLTVRAQDGVFIYDGEGHQVTAEPSIAEGTTVYYSQDLQSWQTEAPTLTDVITCEDGSLGAYLIFALAVNPDCGAALCSYTVTILPEQ